MTRFQSMNQIHRSGVFIRLIGLRQMPIIRPMTNPEETNG
jgi:hypothetical protein